MKKILFFLLLAAVTLCLYAQSESEVLTTKKGVPIKPVPGNYAIGIDATPFFRFAGNIFSANNSYYPTFGFTAQAPGAIVGKYKASENTTYRAQLLLGYSSEKMKMENETDPDKLDVLTTSALSVGLAGGIEKHRAFFGRLSGYYGAQVGISIEPYSDYDNETSQYYDGKYVFKDGNNDNNNYVEKGGNSVSLYGGGFVGVEFYVAPRIALAGEYGYYLEICRQGKRIGKPASGDEIIYDYGSSCIDFMPSASGNLVLLVYF